MAQQILSTNTFTSSTWIVNSDATKGTHTTLAGALTSASSGDTILLQTSVTENPTLKAGVNIVGYAGADLTANVTITGKCTFTGVGNVTMQNIAMTTNSDYILVVSGSSASQVILRNCNLNCSNNTGISYTSSSSGSSIALYACQGALGTTGITYWVATGAGNITVDGGVFLNGGASTTASSTSACAVYMYNTVINHALSTSSTGGYQIYNSACLNAINTSGLTTAGTGTSVVYNSVIVSGTASAISIGTGTTVKVANLTAESSNTNVITGAGTLTNGSISFTGSSYGINSTTINNNGLFGGKQGTFTPGIAFGGSSTGITYATQAGEYTQIGNVVFFNFTIALTSKGAQAGAVTITGFPVNAGGSSGTFFFTINDTSALTFTGYLTGGIASGGSTSIMYSNTAGTVAAISNTGFANNTALVASGFYMTS